MFYQVPVEFLDGRGEASELRIFEKVLDRQNFGDYCLMPCLFQPKSFPAVFDGSIMLPDGRENRAARVMSGRSVTAGHDPKPLFAAGDQRPDEFAAIGKPGSEQEARTQHLGQSPFVDLPVQ